METCFFGFWSHKESKTARNKCYQRIEPTNKNNVNNDLSDIGKEMHKLDENEEICYKDHSSTRKTFESVRRLTKNMKLKYAKNWN